VSLPAMMLDRVRSFPFVETVTSHIPGQELVALCELDLSEDLFLKDHTLGGQVSITDDELLALPVVPLTFSMEMMAQAAAVLVPDKLLVGMKEILAYRWIALDEGRLTLELVARRNPSDSGEVHVQIREVTRRSATQGDQPFLEGTMVFGDAYLEPSPADGFALRSERPSKWTTDELYGGVMFHGPTLRGVASVDLWGEDGTVGTLRILPTVGLFRSTPNPGFLTDPVLLDAAGQLVGYWTAEHLKKGYHVFPFRVEALRVYGTGLHPGELMTCRVRSAMVGEWQIRSDIDIVASDGRYVAQIVGWWDRRFDLPNQLHQLRVSPRESALSAPWSLPIAGFASPEQFESSLVDTPPPEFLEAHWRIWQRVLAHLVLSHRERDLWRSFEWPERRRSEWLLGRVAAKDAVRRWLKTHHDVELCPADVDIVNDERGRPLVTGSWVNRVAPQPVVSIAHSEGVAAAIVGDGSCGAVGIDIEHVGRRARDGFEHVAFTQEERDLLASLDTAAREEWLLRLWCAKEAVAKASGLGMIGGPRGLAIQSVDLGTGTVAVVLGDGLAEALPPLAPRLIDVHTARERDLVVASAVVMSTAERNGHVGESRHPSLRAGTAH
jgi:phosphopantetheinyl transferase